MTINPEELFVPEKHAHLHAPYRQSPYLVWKGLPMDAGRYADWVEEMRPQLLKLPIDEPDESGSYTRSAITADVHKLGSLMSHPGVPEGQPVRDSWKNFPGRQMDKYDEWALRTICRVAFRPLISPVSMSVNIHSSTGAPLASKVLEDKERVIQQWVGRGEEILAKTVDGRFKELILTNSIAYVYRTGRRYQAHKIVFENGEWRVKERYAANRDGSRQLIDFSRPEPFKDRAPWWKPCRPRGVEGQSTGMFGTRIIEREMRGGLDTDAAFTYKHEGPAAMQAKVAMFVAALFFDVKEMDKGIMPAQFAIMLEELSLAFGPAKAAYMALCLFCGIVGYPDRWGEKDAYVMGNPLEAWANPIFLGLPSGIGGTSVMGKLFVSSTVLGGLARAGEVKMTEEAARSWLRGAHPYWGLLNSGDNCCIMGPSRKDIRQVAAQTGWGAFDESDSFLGYILYNDGLTRRFIPNIPSFVNNTAMPGRSRDDDQSTDPILGFPFKFAHYSSCVQESFDSFWKILNGATIKVLGMELPTQPSKEMLAMGIAPSLVNYHTSRFIQKPERIHYEMEPEDVYKPIRDMFFFSVPPEEIAMILAAFEAAVRSSGPMWERRLQHFLTWLWQLAEAQANLQPT